MTTNPNPTEKRWSSPFYATRGWQMLMCLLACLMANAGLAAYIDKDLDEGKVRVHYGTQALSACDAILLGVGTAMQTSSYDKLSEQLIRYGYLVVIMDHAPGKMVKTDAGKYAALAWAVKNRLTSWVAGRSACQVVRHWILGGHSAGGQAAQNAVASDGGLADAMFNLDPFDMTQAASVSVPTLNWGFDVSTCFVDKDKAARLAYEKSQGQRAFVRVAKTYSWGPCGYSPKYFHCSFCDGHCPACTNCQKTPAHFFEDVARSVDYFIQAAFYGTWSRSALSFSSRTPVRLFVDGDQP